MQRQLYCGFLCVCVWNFSREVKLVPAFHLFMTSFQVLDLRYLTLAFGTNFVIHFIGFSWHLVLDNLYYWLTFGIWLLVFDIGYIGYLIFAIYFLKAGGPGPLCQAWSNEARHNGGCNLGRQVVYLQHHGHDEGDVQTLVMRVFLPWVFVSSCWCLLK